MQQICKHCQKADIAKHRPGLDIDLGKAIESGTVFSELSTADFNNLDIDMVQNSTRLREPFDAIEHSQTLAQSFSTEFSSGTGNVTTSTTTTTSTPPDEGSGN